MTSASHVWSCIVYLVSITLGARMLFQAVRPSPPHAAPSKNANAAPPQSAAATLDKKHAQAPPPIEAPPQNVAAGEGDGTASGKSKAKKGAKIVPVETE